MRFYKDFVNDVSYCLYFHVWTLIKISSLKRHFIYLQFIQIADQKIGAGLSYKNNGDADNEEKKLSFVAMAPMISIKKIMETFQLDNSVFSEIQKFIDYVDFSIENFKLAFEVDFGNGGAVQAR